MKLPKNWKRYLLIAAAALIVCAIVIVICIVGNKPGDDTPDNDTPPAHQHIVVTDAAVAPTCTSTGFTEGSHCSECGEVIVAQTVIDKLAHTEVINAAKAPTCDEIGWDEYVTCSECDYTTYEEKSSLGHNEVSHAAKAPTCTEIGWDAYVTCSRCDYTTYAEKSATGHTLGENATCTTAQSCVTCGKVLASEKGHIPGADATCTTSQSCLVCGIVLDPPLGHSEVTHAAKAPTCTQIGWDAYVTCSRCDYTTYKEKSASGHNPGADATCTDAQICTVCGETLKSALGHNEVTHAAKAPTCTQIGWEDYVTCSRCDYTTYDELPSVGHDYVKTWDLCSRCGEIKASEGLAFTSNGDGTCYVTGIGSCTSSQIVIPKYSDTGDKVIGIGDDAFSESPIAYRHHLKKIYIPETVEYIGSYAFFGCKGLSSVILNEGLKEIGGSAFMWCEMMTIDLPESLVKIAPQAFYASSLRSVTIPKNVELIGDGAFGYCGYLTNIVVDEENKYYSSLDGNLYNKDHTELLQYSIAKSVGIFEIPDSVVTIGNSAFYRAEKLNEVVVPSSVITIEDGAFSSSNISHIVLPDSVKTIGDSVFSYCDRLYDISLGNGIEAIGSGAFSNCGSIDYINIPASVIYIGDYVFDGCSELERIVVDVNNSRYYSVDGVLFDREESAIIRCPEGYAESVVTIPEGIERIEYGAFSRCSNLTEVVIPVGVYYIGQQAFWGCANLISVNIPETVDSMLPNAFVECPNLTVYCDFEARPYNWEENWNDGSCAVIWVRCGSEGLEFTSNGDGTCYLSGIGTCTDEHIIVPSISPDGERVVEIGSDAFWLADQQIKSIVILEGVERLGYSSLSSGCAYVEKIVLPASLYDISSMAFYRCVNLKEIIVSADSDSFVSIDGSLYKKHDMALVKYAGGKTDMTFRIPTETSYIWNDAFYGSPYLETIVINYNMCDINIESFCSCENLSRIEVEEGNSYFASVDGVLFSYDMTELLYYPSGKTDTSYVIPESVTGIGEYAFYSYYNSDNLKKIEIPKSVTTIGELALYRCYSLEIIIICDGVTAISDYAFYDCSGVTSIVIPNSVIRIGELALFNCSSLDNITFEGTIAQWNAVSKGNNWNSSTGNYTVYCTDGTIAKDGTVIYG